MISVFLLYISFNKLLCFNWMTNSLLMIKEKKESEKRKANEGNSCWEEIYSRTCYKTNLTIWNFKVVPHSVLLVKIFFFLTKGDLPLIDWIHSSAFSKIQVHFWDGEGGLTSCTPCISFNDQHRSKLRKIISKWSQV